MNPPLHDVYHRLYAEMGPQDWWPGDTPCEIVVGAILVQNTNWKNVERALMNLKRAGALQWEALHEAAEDQIADWIQPAGFYRVKARRLKAFVDCLFEDFGGSLDRIFALGLPKARDVLLGVHGIGPETADCILLYAGNLPVFVVDAYLKRMLERHGWMPLKKEYDAVAKLFVQNIPRDPNLFNEYHALIVRLGQQWCKKEPQCASCPLKEFLPEG